MFTSHPGKSGKSGAGMVGMTLLNAEDEVPDFLFGFAATL